MTRSSLRRLSIGLVHGGLASFLAALSLFLLEGTAAAAGADGCALAPPRLAAGDSDTGSTVGDTDDVSLVPLACNRIYTRVAGPDVFYELVVGPENDFTITVTPSAGYDTSIYLLSRQCGVGAACAAGHGADDNAEGVAETLTLSGLAPGPYYLGIDSFYPATDTRSSGTYSVSVTGTLAVVNEDGGAGDATTGDDAAGDAAGDDAEGDDAATQDAETDAETGDDGGSTRLDSGAHRDAGAGGHADAGHHRDAGEKEGGDASDDDGGSSSGSAASGGCGCRVTGRRHADLGPFVVMGTLGLALAFGYRRRARHRLL